MVSDGEENRKRDLVTKREEYAQASIPEYWIVDPALKTITVLQLPAQPASAAEAKAQTRAAYV